MISDEKYVDLLKKIQDSFAHDGWQLGDTNYTEEEKSLLKELYWEATHSNRIWDERTKKAVTAYLVCVAKNYQGDWSGNGFWNRLKDEIGSIPSYQRELPVLGECLKNSCRPFFSFGKRYVSTISYQSYSPLVSVKSFIKLAWSLYSDEDVFDFDYVNTQRNVLKCMAIIYSLNKKLSGVDLEADSFTFESETYSIRSGLRAAFSEDQFGSANLLHRTLLYIDKIYSKRIDEEDGSFLWELCCKYVPEIIASYSIKRIQRVREKPRETVDEIERIKTSYLLLDNNLYLYLPKTRLFKEDQQFKEATVTVYCEIGGEETELLREKYECVGEDYKHCLREIKLPIGGFLNMCVDSFNVRVTLSFDEQDPCYDSKKSLFRNYLIFEGEKEVKKRTLKEGDYHVAYPPQFNVLENIHSEENRISKSPFIVQIYLNDGDYLSFSGTYYFVGVKTVETSFMFDETETVLDDKVTFYSSSCEFEVYKSLGNLIIRKEGIEQASHLDIEIFDAKATLVERIPTNLCKEDGDVYIFDLSNAIEKTNINGISPFICVIKDQKTDTILFDEKVCVIEDLQVDWKNPMYNGSTKPIKVSLNGVSIEPDEYDVKDESVLIGAYNDDSYLEIGLPFFKWRINSDQVNYRPVSKEKPILPDGFQSNDILFIETSLQDLKVYCGRKTLAKEDGKNNFKLGAFFASCVDNDPFVNHEELYAEATVFGQIIRFPLCYFTDQPYLLSEQTNAICLVENNSVIISLSNIFVGKDETLFKVVLEDQDGVETIKTGKLVKESLLFDELKPDYYDLHIFYQSKGLWRNLISESEIEVGDLISTLYSENDTLIITKISRTKMKNIVLTNFTYGGDNGFGPVFKCSIKTPWFKKENASFMVNAGENISSLSYQCGNEYKQYSFDVKEKALSHHEIDGIRYVECQSIYTKKEE